LAKVEQRANCGPVVRCPLVEEYRIDLGFDLVEGWTNRDAAPTFVDRSLELSQDERRLVGVLQSGLPILSHPYAVLAERAGLTEEALMHRLKGWVERGVIRRFGFVARHHELGFQANAMVVWHVPDVMARSFGSRLAREEGVTLCYRRNSSPPRWPYNLYCMVHGRDKEMTERQIERITESAGLGAFARDVLFGVMRFKQRGARYMNEYTGEPAHA
jgi:siroheme decarboxylase